MLLDQGATGEALQILKGIGAEAFYIERHGKLYDQILRMFDASMPLDSVVFANQLQQEGLLKELGGYEFLGDLIGAVPAVERAEYYARLVRDKYLLRKLIGASHQVVLNALDPRQAVDEVLDEAERSIFAVTEQRVDEEASDLFSIVQEVFEQIENNETAANGVATGFFELDEMTSGLQPAELIIVAGRPSMGKTAFGLNMAEQMAIVDRQPVLFFSLEMSKQQLANRILCSRARVDAHKLRRGMLGPEDLRRLQAAADETRDAPLLVDDTPSLPILSLRARARTQFRKHAFRAIFIDYLQLMRGPKSSESRQVEVAEISRGLKALAKELKVPVIALAQLNRGVEDRGGNRPRMSDLRESGAIEQDADVIGLLHREAYYRDPGGIDFDDPEANLAELIIAKQRNGPVGTVKLHFNRQWTRFDNHAPGGHGAPG